MRCDVYRREEENSKDFRHGLYTKLKRVVWLSWLLYEILILLAAEDFGKFYGHFCRVGPKFWFRFRPENKCFG